jgi:endoglucanase
MKNGAITINPSYLSPYAYRIFAKADLTRPWETLVDTSYETLYGCMSSSLSEGQVSVNLPPNWCEFDENGNFSKASEAGLSSTDYSYDAIRTMWRLALDYKWNKEIRAKNLLDLSSVFLLDKWHRDGKILVGYTHSGEPWEQYESVLGYAMSLANFSITAPKEADEIYKIKILGKFFEDFDKNNSYWEDSKNYYVQNWAWFGTALYADKLPNLTIDNYYN